MQRDAPCKACEKRSPGCHGKCMKYQIWAYRQREAKRKVSDSYTSEHYIPDKLLRMSWEEWKKKARRSKRCQ